MNAHLVANQRGVATAAALLVLMLLTGLALAFLSVSANEPQISRNHADLTRARYAAEAGIEAAFNAIWNNVNWSGYLAGATCATGGGALVAGLTALPSSAGASFAVRVRNDCAASDTSLTGLATEASSTVDANGVLILESTGTTCAGGVPGCSNGATRTIQVVMRRTQLPPFPGALNLPGVQTDVSVINTNFDISGKDWVCTGSTATCDNHTNWTSTGSAALKWGLATQLGNQGNVAGNPTYEAYVESAFDTAAKQANVHGKSEIDGTYTSGLNTIQADGSLNPTVMHQFLAQVASNSATQVLQSTQSCPMVLDGTATANQPTLTNGCGLTQTLDLGTRDNPKMIYFRGDPDPTSAFIGLHTNSGTIKGAGLLIIEDGDWRQSATFDWDGIVIVTGINVAAAFRGTNLSTPTGNTNLFGAMVAMEDNPTEALAFELRLAAQTANFRSSQQNLDMVQFLLKGLVKLYGWREI